ncbi:MAG: Ig-like domain-containing protein [Ekhidna sp.]|nr:Ig-like domain-containing protein [Ekhidna sp.]
MKKYLHHVFYGLILQVIFQQCANPASPTGGPRDTIPPILIESQPVRGQTNFQDKELNFIFSEYVSADQLPQKVIITPKANIKFKAIGRKNRLTVKLEGELEDSTTYNINFADGVVDVTEKNPVEDFSIAFSTGNFIDSMKISGSVVDLFSQEAVPKYTVGLYPHSDTLDFLKDNPLYFTITNDSGEFKLEYIKADYYKILIFDDQNNNILLEPETEQHGFLKDTIYLDSVKNIDESISTLLQDIRPFNYINSRSIGPYIEVKYNKEIDDYSIEPAIYYSNLIGEKKDGIRIYKPEQIPLNDSLQLIITSRDSLENASIDTIKNVFQDNFRKPTPYLTNTLSANTIISDTNTIHLTFNKPSFVTDSLQILLTKDSTLKMPLSYNVEWNTNLTQARMQAFLNKDSVISQILENIPKDSTNEEKNPNEDENINFQLNINISSGSFYSIENDTSSNQSVKYRTTESGEFGTITFQITTEKEYFFTQLLDGQGEVKYSITNLKKPTFPRVAPGEYTIRILIDNNKDGKWSAGNLLKNIEPEDIYIHPEQTTIRENWIQEVEISL